MAKPKAVHNLTAMPATVKRVSEKQMVKEHAKHEKRRATEDWIAGRMSTKDHNAVHARADHVLSGKRPAAFKGKTGERKTRFGTL